MLILSFPDRFATSEFNEEFKVTNFDGVKALIRIRDSSLPEAQCIVSRVADKVNSRYEPLEGSTINSKPTRSCFSSGLNRFHRHLVQCLQSTHTQLMCNVSDRHSGSRSKIVFVSSHS